MSDAQDGLFYYMAKKDMTVKLLFIADSQEDGRRAVYQELKAPYRYCTMEYYRFLNDAKKISATALNPSDELSDAEDRTEPEIDRLPIEKTSYQVYVNAPAEEESEHEKKPVEIPEHTDIYANQRENIQNANKTEKINNDGEGEEFVRPDLLAFLNAETVQEKLEVLREINQNMDDELLTSIELSLDIISEKNDTMERRLDLVELNLKKRAQFENSRLRGK